MPGSVTNCCHLRMDGSNIVDRCQELRSLHYWTLAFPQRFMDQRCNRLFRPYITKPIVLFQSEQYFTQQILSHLIACVSAPSNISPVIFVASPVGSTTGFWDFVHPDANDCSVRPANGSAHLAGKRTRAQCRGSRKIHTLLIWCWCNECITKK